MCLKWLRNLCGLVDDESVKKELRNLRKELISENEERILEEKWKRAEQRDQLDLLRSRINEIERREIQGKIFLEDHQLYLEL